MEKLKSRNDYCNISYSMHESLARIGLVIDAFRRTLRLATPGPSVGGLTGGPGSCSMEANRSAAERISRWVVSWHLLAESIAAIASQQFLALHD